MDKIEFMFDIEKKSVEHINTQIYKKIKSAILDGIYKHGDRLPSVRLASNKLAVSKSSIISAYFQLSTEGYIENIPYKGFFVCKVTGVKKEIISYDLDYKENNIIYINDSIDKQAFPKEVWKKFYTQTLQDESIDLCIQGDEQGEYELRLAIANFIRTNRSCNVNPEQIVIGSGIQNLISMLIKIVSAKYSLAFLENPCYKKVEFVFEDLKFPIKKLSVKDSGINIDDLNETKESLIYTSPSYQYPMGNLMPIDKRFELINYAKDHDCLIIEDDYASSIRYDSKPISSLQSLDPYDNTVYLGSFSKTFLPSLRISFMVLPKKILADYFIIKSRYTHSCSKLEQLTLAKIISKGIMTKHLKKINNIYKLKNQTISRYIRNNYSDKLVVHNNQSGFHIILSCKANLNENFLEDFKNEFLLIDVIEIKDDRMIFLFSYSGLTREEIPQSVDKIVEILRL